MKRDIAIRIAAIFVFSILTFGPSLVLAAEYTFVTEWNDFGATNEPQFYHPHDIAVDSFGNVYVADTSNNRIQRFDSDGNPLIEWGGYGAAAGQFITPYGVAVDGSGFVYVADTGNNRVQKFGSDGFPLAEWGGQGAGVGQFNHPRDVEVDDLGDIYVADMLNHRIQKRDSSTGNWASYGDGQLNYPQTIAIDSSGNVYVAGLYDRQIWKFSRSGDGALILSEWRVGLGEGLLYPQGIATDAPGNVYVTDMHNHLIQKFTDSGAFLDDWGSYGFGDGQFCSPQGMALDSSGNIYVTDIVNNRVQKFDSDRVFQLKWGIFGTGDGDSYFPYGIAADVFGNIYVANTYNHSIQKFTTAGDLIDEFGGYGVGNGQFFYPWDVAADVSGNIYVADASNHRVQKLTSSGGYVTEWGVYGTGSGQFNTPYGVAADAFGYVYVTDFYNHRVQKFTSSGSYVTEWGSYGVGDGQFNGPYGIAVDALGYVYVADFQNDRIQKFDSNGVYQIKWGGSGSGDGQFNRPCGIGVDASGDVYVADYSHRIQKFTGAGGFITRWGSGGMGDGQFRFPYDVALDVSGMAYVTDTFNHRIQVFRPPVSVVLRIVDQNNVDIPGSVIQVLDQDIPTGSTVELPEGVYTFRLLPGIFGGSSHYWLSRFEVAEITTATTELSFEWITSDVMIRVHDQSNTDIEGSTLDLGHGAFDAGSIVTLPITDESVYPTMEGGNKDGYYINLFPGIFGGSSHYWLSRLETAEVNATTTEAAFEWITSEFTIRVHDQDNMDIDGSTLDFGHGAFDAGSPVVLPITDESVYPTMEGGNKDGYYINVYPGIYGVSSKYWLYRYERIEVTEAMADVAFEWIQIEGYIQLLDMAEFPVPDSLLDLPASFPELTFGDRISFLTTDDSIYPTISSLFAEGYPITVTPGDVAPASEAFPLEVLASGAVGPGVLVIGGNTYTLVIADHVANEDHYPTDEDVPLSVPVLGVLSNDIDIDGDALTATLVDDVSNGTLALNPDGSFTYASDLNYNGQDSFTYQAYDGELYSNKTTVFITIESVNDPPDEVYAGPDQAANEGDIVSFIGSYNDPDFGDTHTIEWDFGDGETALGTLTPTHIYGDNREGEQPYRVTLTVTDSNGGMGADELFVTIHNVPPTAEPIGLTYSIAFQKPSTVDIPGMAFGDGFLWMGRYCLGLPYCDETNLPGDSIYKIDPSTGNIVQTYPPATAPLGQETWCNTGPFGLAYDDSGYLWVSSYNDRTIYQVRISDWTIVNRIYIGTRTGGLAFDGTYLYVFLEGYTLVKLTTSGSLVASAGSAASGLTYANGRIWGNAWTQRKIQVIDPDDLSVEKSYAFPPIDEGIADGDLAFDPDAGHIWFARRDDSNVYKITMGSDSPQTVNENSEITLSARFSDPGWLDVHTATIDWGDGFVEPVPVIEENDPPDATGSFSGSHFYENNGDFTVTFTVADDDGDESEPVTISVEVENVPPSVNAGADQTVDEGETVNFSGGFTDPASDAPYAIEWDFGDGNTDTGTLTPSNVYADDDIYTVTLMVTDKDDGIGQDTLKVIVENAAPTVDAGPDQTVGKGDTVSFNGSFTDPGTGDTHNIVWDFGDGNTATGVLNPTHVYVDADDYTVTLTVTDDDDGIGWDTLLVNVLPSLPRISILFPVEGSVVYDKTQVGVEVYDANNDDLTVCFYVDQPNGEPDHTVVVSDTAVPKTVVYNWWTFPNYEDGGHSITVTASDATHTVGDSVNVSVRNILSVTGQIIAFAPGPDPDLPIGFATLKLILDGEEKYSVLTDTYGRYEIQNVLPNVPGERYYRQVSKDGVELEIFGGDKKVYYNPGVDVLDEVIKIKNYGVSASCPIDLHVYDAQGAHTGLAADGTTIELGIPLSWHSGDSESEKVVVLNPDYVYTAVAVGTGTGTFDLTISNYITVNGMDFLATINIHQSSINLGDEIPFTYDFGEIEMAVNAIVGPDATIEEIEAAIQQVTQCPVVMRITAPVEPVQVGQVISVSSGFSDWGISDSHAATWDWGDGSTLVVNVSMTDGYVLVSGNHIYDTPGVYEVKLTVSDSAGNTGESVFRYVVIYDPEGGFVTGGGWIRSPSGAYVPDPSLTGKATFGFVSKYKKGATVPSGETQFDFNVADLNFHSTEYQWLVIAGSKAKYKGDGTINGEGEYGFMLTAIDGDLKDDGEPDKFRIKIWEKATEYVVYDNQMGDPDDADASTELGGGSIVIHSDKDKDPEAAPQVLPGDTCLLLAYPNPFNPDVWIPYRLNSNCKVVISIRDISGRLVRTMNLGNQPAGYYVDKSKAAYWDGRNEAGEKVASGLYFYTIQAGQYTATKKMVVSR